MAGAFLKYADSSCLRFEANRQSKSGCILLSRLHQSFMLCFIIGAIAAASRWAALKRNIVKPYRSTDNHNMLLMSDYGRRNSRLSLIRIKYG